MSTLPVKMLARPLQRILRPRHSRIPAQQGFTLLEVLVAVVIFGIISVLAYGGYNQLIQQSDIVERSASRTRAVQSTVQRMSEDFEMLEPRPVREPLGETLEPALRSGGTRVDTLLDLTRSGWTNPAGLTRPTLQRVAYRLVDNKLERAYWNALDRTMTTEPTSAVLIDKVRTASFRFMDQNQTWHDQWPPLGYSGPDSARLRPIAVEITLELEDWGKLVRLVEVSG
jgi:general secretion pathway protein J